MENDLIPTTVTELYDANRASRDYGQLIQDLYRIVHKLSAENKALKLSVNEQQEIIENEVCIEKLRDFFRWFSNTIDKGKKKEMSMQKIF